MANPAGGGVVVTVRLPYHEAQDDSRSSGRR
jgi:hypothetical protein